MGVPYYAGNTLNRSQISGSPLGIATCDHKAGARIFPMDPANHGTGFSVGGMSYRAGIDYDDVGMPPLDGFLIAVIQKSFFERCTIGLGRATPKIYDVESR